MRVWILNHYAGPPNTTPGTRTFDLGRELIRMGHEVTVFACSFNHYSFREEQLKGVRLFRTEVLEGVRFVWIRGFPYKRNGGRRFINMAAYAILASLRGATLGPSPDLIIGETVHPLAPVAAFFLSRLRRSRFWLDITDIWPESLVDLGHLRPGSLAARVIGALESFSLRRAELVVSVLPNIGQYVRDMGLDGKPTAWIPNGIDSKRANSITESCPETGHSGFMVAYAGGFAPAHALENILDAAAILRERGRSDIEFLLIGDGPEMGMVKGKIRDLGLTNVHLTGLIPKQQVYPELTRAEVLLCTGRALPVYRYGVSFNKIFDYLLVGRPVVFALNSSNDPISEAGAGFSIPAEDPAALADAIHCLYDMPPGARRDMGQRGRRFVLEEFDYSVLAERLARFF